MSTRRRSNRDQYTRRRIPLRALNARGVGGADGSRPKAGGVLALPFEILACIFQHCVKEDLGTKGGKGLGMSPRTLVMVNKLWCKVALCTSSLWGTILVTDSPLLYWKLARNSHEPAHNIYFIVREEIESLGSMWAAAEAHSAMQICTTTSQLDHCLRRSGVTPLNITFAFISHVGTDRGLLLAYEFYRMIFNAQIAPRVAHLVFEEGATFPMSPALTTYLSSAVFPFTNLVGLDFLDHTMHHDFIEGVSPLQVVLENGQKLQEFSFQGRGIPRCLSREFWPDTRYRSTIEQLKRVTVTHGTTLEEIFGDVVPVSEVVIEEAGHLPDGDRLWKLSLRPWPIVSTPQMTFTRLTRIHLTLRELSALSRITIPLLEHLQVIEAFDGHRDGMDSADEVPLHILDFEVEFPKLRTIRIAGPWLAPLSRISMPQLENLHLTSMSRAKAKAEADFALLFPSVLSDTPELAGQTTFASSSTHIHTLYINADVSESCLLQALHSLPLLQVLTLVPGRQFGHALVKELTVGEPEGHFEGPLKDVLCPELRVLELDFYSFVEWDERGRRVGTSTSDGMPELLEKLVASRNQGEKHPLKRVSMTTEAVGSSHKAYREFV